MLSLLFSKTKNIYNHVLSECDNNKIHVSFVIVSSVVVSCFHDLLCFTWRAIQKIQLISSQRQCDYTSLFYTDMWLDDCELFNNLHISTKKECAQLTFSKII